MCTIVSCKIKLSKLFCFLEVRINFWFPLFLSWRFYWPRVSPNLGSILFFQLMLPRLQVGYWSCWYKKTSQIMRKNFPFPFLFCLERLFLPKLFLTSNIFHRIRANTFVTRKHVKASLVATFCLCMRFLHCGRFLELLSLLTKPK